MTRELCEHWSIEKNCQECKDHEDVIMWPDNVWCYRYELEEMAHKSDDYQVIKFGTKEHERVALV